MSGPGTESRSAHRGTLLLTLAQAYHALTGYFIFITVARILGQEAYAAFTLVLWTMTTLEVFVVDGVPKAVSYFVARLPAAVRAVARRGFWITIAGAAGLTVLLAAAAPWICEHWKDPGLVRAVRLSSLDFVAFVGFAVYVQAVNGLHLFGRQAAIWFVYSTSKTALVVFMVQQGHGIEGAAIGYAAASLLGSIGAFVLGRTPVGAGRDAGGPGPGELLRFGLPVSTQALALQSLVNVDLWAANNCDAPKKLLGAYGASATLARALFFIFRAFGEALFPAVARHLAAGAIGEARRSARKGLGLLAALLLPAAGLATGTAETVLAVLFDDPGYAAGGPALRLLAPAGALWAFTAVLAALVSASSRPWRVALFLAALLAVEAKLCYALADGVDPLGAALGALIAGAAGVVAGAYFSVQALGAILPWRALAAASAGAFLLDRALDAWHPETWLVFPYGAALYGGTVVLVLAAGGFRAGRR